MFWMVGAYNRLVGLRHEIGAAWAQADEQLRRRAQALPTLVEMVRDALPDEGPIYEAVVAAGRQVQVAADALRPRPLVAREAQNLATAEGVLGAAFARLRTLFDAHPSLAESGEIDETMRELHDVDLRLGFARQHFNRTVDTYNAAVGQFPTHLLASMFGFHPAGRI